MRYARSSTEFTCGVDLHSRNMRVCVLEQSGRIVFSKTVPCNEEEFVGVVQPYAGEVSVAVESTFNWYWLGDACQNRDIPFYLGHALYMKHIYGSKKKNDKIDARKIGHLLRTGFFPLAYPYPRQMRGVRDLLRMRHILVRRRSGAYTSIKATLYQQGISDFPSGIASAQYLRRRLLSLVTDPCVSATVKARLHMIDALTGEIEPLETMAVAYAREHETESLGLLKTIPGTGDIIGISILYEAHTMDRFRTPGRFSSYARAVKVDHTSDGKPSGVNRRKIGNPYLAWAFAELTIHAIRTSPAIKQYYERLRETFGKKLALARLTHKFVVVVYYMLKHRRAFDVNRFCTFGESDNPTAGLADTTASSL